MLTLLSLYTLLVPLILATSYENVNSRIFWYHDAAELILVSTDHIIAHVSKKVLYHEAINLDFPPINSYAPVLLLHSSLKRAG